MSKIKESQIFDFMELIQLYLTSKKLLNEESSFMISFDIKEKTRSIKVSCNQYRIMIEIDLDITQEQKLVNRLKYFLNKRKKEGTKTAWDATNKCSFKQMFQFCFSDYDEFVNFYEKYLI